MKPFSSWNVLIALMLLAVAFVYLSSQTLPAVVASHFTLGGQADGYMRRDGYLRVMLGTVVGVPLLMIAVSSVVRLIPLRFVNVPNREYWLAPERSTETVAYVVRQGRVFGALMTGFLCFVHWLVVLANRQYPAHFPESLFVAGFSVFVAAVVVWLVLFFGRFRRRE